jgi:hypothetical protein
MKHGDPGGEAENDRPDLAPGGWERQNNHRGSDGNRRAIAVGRQRAHHTEHGLRHHRDRHDLQAVQPAAAERIAEPPHSIGEQHQRERRGQGEASPGGQRARVAGAKKSNRDADLGAGWTGQELRQRDEVGVGLLVEPFAALDEFGAEIAEMRDRPAERSQTKAEKNAEYLAQTRMRPWRLL